MTLAQVGGARWAARARRPGPGSRSARCVAVPTRHTVVPPTRCGQQAAPGLASCTRPVHSPGASSGGCVLSADLCWGFLAHSGPSSCRAEAFVLSSWGCAACDSQRCKCACEHLGHARCGCTRCLACIQPGPAFTHARTGLSAVAGCSVRADDVSRADLHVWSPAATAYMRTLALCPTSCTAL